MINEKIRNYIAREWAKSAKEIVRSGRVPTADEEMEIIIAAYEAAKTDQPVFGRGPMLDAVPLINKYNEEKRSEINDQPDD